MMKVQATVREVALAGDDYKAIESVVVVCTRCDYGVAVYGRGENSIRRGAAQLRQMCPKGERNFYVVEGHEEPEPEIVKAKDFSDEDLIAALRRQASTWFKNNDMLLLEELIKRYRRSQPDATEQPPVRGVYEAPPDGR